MMLLKIWGSTGLAVIFQYLSHVMRKSEGKNTVSVHPITHQKCQNYRYGPPIKSTGAPLNFSGAPVNFIGRPVNFNG